VPYGVGATVYNNISLWNAPFDACFSFFLSQTCRSLSIWFFWTPLTAPLRSSRFSALSASFSAPLTYSDFNIQDGWAAKHDEISIKLPPNLLENFYTHSTRALYICVVAWILWHDFFFSRHEDVASTTGSLRRRGLSTIRRGPTESARCCFGRFRRRDRTSVVQKPHSFSRLFRWAVQVTLHAAMLEVHLTRTTNQGRVKEC